MKLIDNKGLDKFKGVTDQSINNILTEFTLHY